MSMRFANRSVIVTGAAGGIGLACVNLFLEEGANVVLADIHEENLADVIAEIPREFAKRASPVVCDVTNKRQVDALIGYAISTFGQFDAIVCAAGTMQRGPFSDISEDDFDRIIRTNLKGSFLCVQAAAKSMLELRERGRDILGSIVTFSNDSAFEAIPHITAHVMAAGGVEKLTKTLARGLSQAQIRINTVAAGLTDTAMLRTATGTGKTAFNAGLARMTQGRVHAPQEIAQLVGFLSSAEASAMTGQIVSVGAGL
jgi:NAD(P)-dependent dehydrogenase (short-subunit alcohol dehydrogenase family)